MIVNITGQRKTSIGNLYEIVNEIEIYKLFSLKITIYSTTQLPQLPIFEITAASLWHNNKIMKVINVKLVAYHLHLFSMKTLKLNDVEFYGDNLTVEEKNT